MLSRPHPRCGWLHLQPADWRASLQRQIEERDRLNDPTRSGPPPEWCRWVDECQIPRLAQRPGYQRQFADRVAELEMKLANLEREITMQAGALLEQQALVEVEHQQLAALVEVLP